MANSAPSFGSGGTGIVYVNVAGATGVASNATAETLLVQPDGRILVAGGAVFTSPTQLDIYVARRLPDGRPDTTFDGDGIAVFGLTGANANESAYGAALQSDGAIVVSGFRYVAPTWSILTARLTADGALDPTFGGSGVVTTTPSSLGGHQADAVAVQADGKLLVAGRLFGTSGKIEAAVLRYNPDGTPDTGFSGDGIAAFALSATSGGRFSDVAIQPDGRIVLAGWHFENARNTLVIARLNSDGTPDASFAGGGFSAVAPYPSTIGSFKGGLTPHSVVLQPDGRILVGAVTEPDGLTGRFGVLRFNADGSLDASFGAAGLATVQPPWFAPAPSAEMILQPDGKIVVGGYGYADIGGVTSQDWIVSRLNADGSVDTGFGTGGSTVTRARDSEIAQALALQPDGKILLAGQSGPSYFAGIVRYHPDGRIDTAFGGSGALDGSPLWTPGEPPVVLDADVQVYDTELQAANDFAGASLVLARAGGANASDRFWASGTLGALTEGGPLVVGGATVGTVVANTGGRLELVFSGASQAQVNAVLQQIAYSSTASTPPASVTIGWSFSDGNTGAQGTGGALAASGATVVRIAVPPDTTAPEAPVIASITDDLAPITGIVPPNGSTDDAQLLISGTAEPGATVRLFDGVVQIGQATASGSGAWEFTTAALAAGAHTFTARAVDAASNVSAASAPYPVTIAEDPVTPPGDTTPPAPPVIASVTDDGGRWAGTVAPGGLLDDLTPTLAGSAEPDSTVQVFVNGAALAGTTVVAGDGSWSFTPGQPLAPGELVFTARATDAAANTGAASAGYAVSMVNVVVGTPGPDTLGGVPTRDWMTGLAGNDTLAGGAGHDTIDGGDGTDTVIAPGPTANYTLALSAAQIVLADATAAGGTDELTNVERLQFADKAVIVESRPSGNYANLPESLWHFFIVAFNAAPGVEYMDQLAEAYNFGLTVKEIVDIFTGKPQFTDTYPLTLTHQQLAEQLVANIVKASASEAAKQEAIADIRGALDLGWSRGDVIYTVFGNLASKPFTDATWGNTARQFYNQIAVSKVYTEGLDQSTTHLPTLRDVLQPVTQATDVSSQAGIVTLIGNALLDGVGA